MLKRRFIPYIVGASIIVLISVSYIGYRAYQRHVELERFISKAQAFPGRENNATDTGGHTERERSHSHLSTGRQPSSSAENGSLANLWLKRSAAQNTYSGVDKHKMFMEWIDTGKKNDLIETYIKESQANNPFREKVIQRVVSPQGQIHTVLVPKGYEYQEGDTILRSELDPPTRVFSFGRDPMKLTVGGVEYDVPGYHSIADPYEREEYFNKFAWSIENGVSIAEVERKVEAGELDFSLSEEMIRYVDRLEEQRERAQWLSDQFAKPLPPDRPPVKVSFLPDEGEGALPGWMRKWEGETEFGGSNPATERNLPLDTDTAPAGSDVPLSPADLPDRIKPISPQSVADLEKQLTPQGIEAELNGELSTDSFDKVQPLIDQYGTEEGLRRLREIDPEEARRFERDRQGEPSRSSPKADGYSELKTAGQSPDDSP